jgi:hypothetical protein
LGRAVRLRWLFGGSLALVAACGARTELYVWHHDAAPDVFVPEEAGPDVIEEDAPEFPPLDATKHDVDTTGCPTTTFVYTVATNDVLLRFDPPTASFFPIAQLYCPANGSHPFSMAVDRKGTAYVEYQNGMLFAVSTTDGSCKKTQYIANNLPPFGNFGMGYATIGFGPDEQLFIAADAPGTLGRIDTQNAFQILPVGIIHPDVTFAELTGTGDGRLYAFYGPTNDGDTWIAELDKVTGEILGQDTLPGVHRGTGWAFAYWGGDFWIFTTPQAQLTWHYDPLAKTATPVAHYGASIVGAGVSTCAPQ